MKGRAFIGSGALALAVAGGGVAAWSVLGGSGSDNSQPVGSGGAVVTVTDAWVSVSLDVGAGYAVFENTGEDDSLSGVASPAVGTATLMDESTHGGGHDGHGLDSFPVPSGTSELAPGVAHVMLEDLSPALEPGDQVELEFTFERAGRVTVEADVLDWSDVVDRLDGGD